MYLFISAWLPVVVSHFKASPLPPPLTVARMIFILVEYNNLLEYPLQVHFPV
jgi:hypothetical protein